MSRPKYELYWEDIGERLLYAELDDCSWRLAEKMFHYKKKHSLYIYHSGRLAAFFSKEDAKREAEVGYRFYNKRRNVERVIKLKAQAASDAKKFLRTLAREHSRTVGDQQLRALLLKTVRFWHKVLSVHFLSQPQFFTKFEQADSPPRKLLARVAKARFKTRVAFTAVWSECRQLAKEYGRKIGLKAEAVESLRYQELATGRFNKAPLRSRSQRFVLVSQNHSLRVYTGKTVDKYIRRHEVYKKVKSVTGVIGNGGQYRGRAFVIKNEWLDFQALPGGMKKGMVLIVQNAWPELAQYYAKAGAFVTNEGGITSHGTVVARELKIPCIVGTRIATKIFKTGDRMEVNANTGVVKKIENKKRGRVNG